MSAPVAAFVARAVIAAACLAGAAPALDPARAITQYAHTSWTQRDGLLLPGVRALAQTKDGYLWLGTDDGLLRFDGLKLTEWRPRAGLGLSSSSVVALRASRDGSLWAGLRGGVAHIQDGTLSRYTARQGAPPGSVVTLLEDRQGALWAGSVGPDAGGLARWQGGRWQSFGTRDGLPDRQVHDLLEDGQGRLWVSTGQGVVPWRSGPEKPLSGSLTTGVRCVLGKDREGAVLAAAQKAGLLRLAGEAFSPVDARLPELWSSPTALLHDRDGGVWVGTASEGLFRLYRGRVDRFTHEQGLSSDSVWALLEDREGNLWVGTSGGLDRLRERKVATVGTREGLAGSFITALHKTRDGALWVGTREGLNCIRGGRMTVYGAAQGVPAGAVSFLHEDRQGRLWAGTTKGLATLRGGRFVALPVGGPAGMNLFAMGEDSQGRLWFSDVRQGTLRLESGALVPANLPEPAAGRTAFVYRQDRRGDLWMGFHEGGVARLRDGAFQFFSERDGLGKGYVVAIHEDREGGLWFGTEGGLSRFAEGRFTTWSAQNGLPDGKVHDIIEDDHGTLWLNTDRGLVAVPPEGRRRLSAGQFAGIPFAHYGLEAGMRSRPLVPAFSPRVAKAADGRLWFSTEQGAAVVDPARLRSDPVPPPVVVEQAMANGRQLDLRTPAALPPNDRNVQFDYTALSLTMPEQVRFRYRLEGYDRHWVEAGTRRQAFYTNLPPRDYRFRVIASNGAGTWSEEGTTYAFSVQPAFHQTLSFLVLCGLMVMAAAIALHLMRLRHAEERHALVLAERTRIAQELHDTLLQGFFGVLMLLDAAGEQLPARPEEAKRNLEGLSSRLRRILEDGRRAVWQLRTPPSEDGDLASALAYAGRQLFTGTAIEFRTAVTGPQPALSRESREELLRIGREALTNALRHAEARRVSVEIHTSRRGLLLRVHDDGRGMEPGAAERAGSHHLGLSGMRTRAERLGGRVTVHSRPGAGTQVEVWVPHRAASLCRSRVGLRCWLAWLTRTRRCSGPSQP